MFRAMALRTVRCGAVRVTLDIESEQLHRLTDDQRTAIRENLKTLGFADDAWGMS
jgi:hypothetical protein